MYQEISWNWLGPEKTTPETGWMKLYDMCKWCTSLGTSWSTFPDDPMISETFRLVKPKPVYHSLQTEISGFFCKHPVSLCSADMLYIVLVIYLYFSCIYAMIHCSLGRVFPLLEFVSFLILWYLCFTCGYSSIKESYFLKNDTWSGMRKHNTPKNLIYNIKF